MWNMFAEQCEQPRTRDWCVPDMSHTVKLINMKGTVIVSQFARMTRGYHEDDSCRSIVGWMYCRGCEAPLGAVVSARCGPSMCSNAFFQNFIWNLGMVAGPSLNIWIIVLGSLLNTAAFSSSKALFIFQGLTEFSQFSWKVNTFAL